ncbi:MAG: hypothetical protein ACLFU8_08230 [Anaerolineales bacterium]
MQYLYPLLIYAGLAGTLVLLTLEMVSRAQRWRRPAAALWLTLVTLLWMALPTEGRWIFSMWAPSTVLDGQFIVEMQPAIWWLGLALGLAFSGVAWVEVIDRRPALPLSGVLVLLSLYTTWLALAGGSLLTTLAMWAVFDLLWGAATLLASGEGERVTFGWLFHGVASILLWATFLLLRRAGSSGLWWIMWTTPATTALLLVAALLRIGVYPFHVVFPRRIERLGSLVLVSSMGPVLGVGLLYRILTLPGEVELPLWVLVLGAVSLLWGGVRAWGERGEKALLWAIYALLSSIVAGAGATGAGDLVLGALGVWFGGWTLLLLSRGRDREAVALSWPGWLALLLLVGVPPSPLGELGRAALTLLPWGWRIVFLLGWAIVVATLLKEGTRPALGRTLPPRSWQQATLLAGLILPVLGMLSGASVPQRFNFNGLGLLLWGGAVLLGAGLAWKGLRVRRWVMHGVALWDSLDLQWFYRALWRGSEHLLGLVRVAADVVEGSGALLWSLLVLLIILLVTVNR